MKAEFSLNYGENRFTFPAKDGEVYQLDKGVSVTVSYKNYQESDAMEWVVYFENNGESNSKIFSDIRDCDTVLPLKYPPARRPGYKPMEGDACVVTMNGMVDGSYYWTSDKISANEYAFNYEYLGSRPKTFANIGGRSSDGLMPFFDVTAEGCGYIVAVGWTGDWKAEFAKNDEGVSVKTGLRNARFYLKPGEKIRTSSVLIMQYAKGEDKHNKFRRLIKNHFSHKSNTKATRDSLMAFELWGGLTSEEMKKRINELHKYDIKFEDIWIDAGWYGECKNCDEAFSGDWGENTGDWRVNKRVHPNMLTDVSDYAVKAGMNLMLWIEPERCIKGTPITKEHPEWFIFLDNRSSAILNYANKEARDFVRDLILDFVKRLNLSCYRQDFNIDLTSYFEKNDEENRRGISEIKHITGMYEVWDSVLSECPHLLIDNCSSGGRRIDVETLKRSIPFFRSDYQCNFTENPDVLQVHNVNISAYLPYNGCTSKTKSDTYAIRSSYSSSWGGAFYNAIFQSMDENDFAWAKKITDEYRSIRGYMDKDFYNHGSSVLDDTSWAILQYHDAQSDSGIIIAFRRSKSPFDRVTVNLQGVDGSKRYVYKNLNDDTTMEGTSKKEIVLEQKRSSVVFEYKPLK